MDEIIFGKRNDLEKIVSIEPKDHLLEVFFEKSPGVITSEWHKNHYWLLSNTQLDKAFVRLRGNLFYKWGKQYVDRSQFLKERNIYRNKDIYSVFNPKEAVAIQKGYSCFLGMKPDDVSLLSFDIETTGLDPEAKDAKILLISTAYRACSQDQNRPFRKYQKKLFAYDEYSSQGKMLEAFVSFVQETNPSIILGHNIQGFDLNYLQVIADKENVSLAIGRDGSKIQWDTYEKKYRVDGSRDLHYTNCHIYGREIVDSLFLSIKADISRKYNSYGLKPIIEQEGWMQPNRILYNAADIRKNYKDPIEWRKIKLYCEGDALDAITLYDKFIPPFFYMCQSVSKGGLQNLVQSASGSQLNSIMCRAYLQNGHSLPKADEEARFEGAIAQGNSGVYNNMLKLDISSLYPSVMIEYGIFPRLKDPKEYFPFLVKYFREERLKNKKFSKETGELYYSHLEQSQKIQINSLYGFMGAPGLLFNHVEGAAEVTKRGREILNRGMQFVRDKNMLIGNVDTDAILFGFPDGKEMTKEFQKEIRNELNLLFPKTISWEFDGYFSKVIILKAKNYILYDGNKIKYKGSALRSPSLEPALKEFINRIVEAILKEETNYTEIYNEYVKEILNLKDIKRWSVRKTISQKTLESKRTNEVRIRDAVEDTEYVSGDRIYCFFKNDGTLSLTEHYNGDYNIKKLLEKLHKAGKRFETILDTKTLFPNMALKRNTKILEELNGR